MFICNSIYVIVAVNELSLDSEKIPELIKEIKNIANEACNKIEATKKEEKKEEVKDLVDKVKEIPGKIDKEKEKVEKKIKELKTMKAGGKWFTIFYFISSEVIPTALKQLKKPNVLVITHH